MTITGDTSILTSAPRAAPEQCVRFMLARPHGEYKDNDIASAIVPGYFTTCASVGVDPVILIAQMIHETGNLTSWWSGRPRRNPAGIGVTGRTQDGSPDTPPAGAWAWDDSMLRWREGVSFPTWPEHSVPAHLGRLLAYVLRDDQANQSQRELIATA